MIARINVLWDDCGVIQIALWSIDLETDTDIFHATEVNSNYFDIHAIEIRVE